MQYRFAVIFGPPCNKNAQTMRGKEKYTQRNRDSHRVRVYKNMRKLDRKIKNYRKAEVEKE